MRANFANRVWNVDGVGIRRRWGFPLAVEDSVLDRMAPASRSGLDVQDGLELAGVQADDDAEQLERFRHCLGGALPADFTPAIR